MNEQCQLSRVTQNEWKFVRDSNSSNNGSMSDLGVYSGSKFIGTQKDYRFDGTGTFHFPDGSYYEGEFKHGSFHGKGTVHFPGGAYVATWDTGKVVEGEYVFKDGLKYVHPPTQWTYCTPTDRRFHSELEAGILPAGETQLTNARPAVTIPPGCFDAGDGYYDPKRGDILSYEDHSVVRKARAEEVAWISRKCAYGDGGGLVSGLRASLSSR